jgi:hypothetical protein
MTNKIKGDSAVTATGSSTVTQLKFPIPGRTPRHFIASINNMNWVRLATSGFFWQQLGNCSTAGFFAFAQQGGSDSVDGTNGSSARIA